MDYPKKKKRRRSMTQKNKNQSKDSRKKMPSAEEVLEELGRAETIDDFYGKDGIFARLFSSTIEEM